jgi:hypothetical protein
MGEKESAPGQQAGRFKDARGKLVTLLDPYALNLLRRHDVIPAEPLNDIAGEIGSGWARKQQIACLIAWTLPPPVIAITWIAKSCRGAAFGTFEPQIGTILVANYVLGVCIIWWWARRNRVKRACKVILKHLCCPHCGYDLRMLPTDPSDGATVCPECGCAWKLEDLTVADRVNGDDSS